MRLSYIAFGLIATFVSPVWAITVEDLDATRNSGICQQNMALVAEETYKENGCGNPYGRNSDEETRRITACQKGVDDQNKSIRQYNDFVKRCRAEDRQRNQSGTGGNEQSLPGSAEPRKPEERRMTAQETYDACRANGYSHKQCLPDYRRQGGKGDPNTAQKPARSVDERESGPRENSKRPGTQSPDSDEASTAKLVDFCTAKSNELHKFECRNGLHWRACAEKMRADYPQVIAIFRAMCRVGCERVPPPNNVKGCTESFGARP